MNTPDAGEAPANSLRGPRAARRVFSRRFVRELLSAAGVGALACLLWITHAGLWSSEAWQTPVSYEGDALQILGWIQAASEGEYHFLMPSFISRLGAPFDANWNDYPMYEKLFTILLGIIARFIGLIPASHVGMILTHAFACISFYLVCRWFRWNRLWSLTGALLFGFLYYNYWRNLAHLLLGLTYTIPLALLASWLISSSHRLRRYSSSWKICVAVSLLMGISNPYYLNVYVQLLALALLIQWLTKRRRENLEAGIVCIAVAGVAFLLAHTGMLAYKAYAGKNSVALVRTYAEAERYALRPIHLFLPPPDHRVPALAERARRHTEATILVGESFSSYLGIVISCALLGLLAVSIRRQAIGQVARIPVSAYQLLWIVAYSVIGGVNCWLAFFGINYFRASTRNTVFLAAIALLWLVSWCSRRTRTWPFANRALCATLILAIGLFDQLPANKPLAPNLAREFQSDRQFFAQVESSLPPATAAFVLPVASFPEGWPVEGMNGYDPLRPYLFTKQMRFSYGSNKGRADAGWQLMLERRPAREVVSRLESYGFGALLINRAGYVDHARSLVASLEAMGYRPALQNESGSWLAVELKPANPLQEINLTEYPIISYGEDWRRSDLGDDKSIWLYAKKASLTLSDELFGGKRLGLRAELAVPTERLVKISLAETTLWEEKLKPGQIYVIELPFTSPRKPAPLVIAADAPQAVFPDFGRPVGSFAVISIDVKEMK